MPVRPLGPWIRSVSYLLLAGCAGVDSSTGAAPAPRFAVDPGAATIAQELPDPPPPGFVPETCGRCALRCGDAQRCLGDVCAERSDGVPRLLTPESLGRVTSQQPTFRWVLPADVQGGRLQLCHDRLCRELVQSVDLVGEAFRPERPLAPGVYFWRVQARRGTFLSEKPTPVWEFVVGARDQGTDTVMDHLVDYNGDGYADLALRLDESRPVGIYHGGPAGPGPAPASRIAPPPGDPVRISLAAAGDLDGDGYGDAVMTTTRANDPAQRTVALYHGGARGLAAEPEQLAPLAGGALWPDSYTSAGDLTGAGNGALRAADRERGATPGRVRVFFGGARGLQEAPGVLLQGRLGDGLGASLSGGGDVNGDGLPDVVVGAPAAVDPGAAYVWINRPDVCVHTEATRLMGDPGGASLFGRAVSVLGDFNGDGHGDPLVAEPYAATVTGRSRALLFAGGPAGVGVSPAVAAPFAGAQVESIRLRAGGDFNGDGYGDLVAWMHNEEHGPTLSLFYGSPAGLLETASRVVRASDLGSNETALSFAWTGDSDRDGFDELALATEPTHWIWLRGSADGLRVVDGSALELP